jgi:hypothetical protein
MEWANPPRTHGAALNRPDPLNSHTGIRIAGGGSTRRRKSQRRNQRLTGTRPGSVNIYPGQIPQAGAPHVPGDRPARRRYRPIVGAGIGAPAAALALRNCDVDTVVLEQADQVG